MVDCIRCFGRAVLLLNLGTAEHTLCCQMGGDAEQQDDAASVPSHDVTLAALLPDAPSGVSAEAAGAAAKQPCIFFDYAIGQLQLQLAAPGAASIGTLQLGIFEVRTARSV